MVGPFLKRFQRPHPQPLPPPPSSGDAQAPVAATEQPPARRPPTPGQIRRERRALVRAREERIRDLGGLFLEMYKRGQFNQELYFDQCAEVVSMEERIQELDGMLVSVTRMTLADTNRCACGAPIVPGAHFCANCGRAVGEAAVVACAYCGNPLPADASFCANCGRPAEPAAPQPPAQEAASAQPGHEVTMEASGGTSDPWER
jgi:hypothetical protein